MRRAVAGVAENLARAANTTLANASGPIVVSGGDIAITLDTLDGAGTANVSVATTSGLVVVTIGGGGAAGSPPSAPDTAPVAGAPAAPVVAVTVYSGDLADAASSGGSDGGSSGGGILASSVVIDVSVIGGARGLERFEVTLPLVVEMPFGGGACEAPTLFADPKALNQSTVCHAGCCDTDGVAPVCACSSSDVKGRMCDVRLECSMLSDDAHGETACSRRQVKSMTVDCIRLHLTALDFIWLLQLTMPIALDRI